MSDCPLPPTAQKVSSRNVGAIQLDRLRMPKSFALQMTICYRNALFGSAQMRLSKCEERDGGKDKDKQRRYCGHSRIGSLYRFPRSTWGYIVFIVGGIWAYQSVFPTRRNSRLLTRLLEPRRPPQRRHWKPRLEQRRALRRLKCPSPVHRPPQLLQPLGSSQMTTLCHWPRRHLCRQLPCHRTQHLLLPPAIRG